MSKFLHNLFDDPSLKTIFITALIILLAIPVSCYACLFLAGFLRSFLVGN